GVDVTDHSTARGDGGVREGKGVGYIEKLEAAHCIPVVSRIGIGNPQATTSLGRAMLATHVTTRSDLDGFLGDESTDQVWRAVESAHAAGFALEIEENEAGISCVDRKSVV